MLDQLSSAGFDAARQPTDRLFFAIFPDVAAAMRIAELGEFLRHEHRLHGRPLARERLHVTLHHLGDYTGLPQDVVAMADEAASAVAMPPFEVAFDRAASFDGPRNRPLVLRGDDGIAALMTFQRALGMAMKKAGLGSRVGQGYTPHVTLMYDDRGIAEHVVETIAWTVHEFVLVHSLLGRTRHVTLARWPLRSGRSDA